MSIQVGDIIKLDGKECKVVGRQAAGKHVRWILDDKREIIDLHKNSDVEILKPQLPPLDVVEPKKESWSDRDDDGLYPHDSWNKK